MKNIFSFRRILIFCFLVVVAVTIAFAVKYQRRLNAQREQTQALLAAQQRDLDESRKQVSDLQQENEKAKSEQDKQLEEIKKGLGELKHGQSAANLDITSEDLAPYLSGVVEVSCKGTAGSGTLWKIGSEYYVLTNAHVVERTYPNGSCGITVTDGSGSLHGLYRVYKVKNSTLTSGGDRVLLRMEDYSNLDTNVVGKLKKISELNYKVSTLPYCPDRLAEGSQVRVVGYPAFAKKDTYQEDLDGYASQSFRTVTNGIVSGYDTSLQRPLGADQFGNYFVSAKIDSGNSGGIALSKTSKGLCVLGIPTWLTVGNYETQGVVQNILNVFK